MDVVDYFLIVEADSSFSGLVKKSSFYVDKYKDMFESLNKTGKIIIEKIVYEDKHGQTWDRERHQRNVIKDIVLDRFPNSTFILLVSDVDEIPNKNVISNFTANYNNFKIPNHLWMTIHYYSFTWVRPDAIWANAFAVNSDALRTLRCTIHSQPCKLDQLRLQTKNIRAFPVREVHNAGWHCSFCMSVENIRRKIQSYSHQEFNNHHVLDEAWIDKCRREGLDVLKRKKHDSMVLEKYNGSYPVCELCKIHPNSTMFDLPSW